VESIVAILLLTTAVIAIMTLQPTSQTTSAKADNLGKAVMILHKEFMIQEALIMNPCNAVTTGTVDKTVYTSYQTTAQSGDTRFNVRTVTSAIVGSTNRWRVTITVTWPSNTKGITDNIIITRQESFRFPDGCT
jgi:hypothetical protein